MQAASNVVLTFKPQSFFNVLLLLTCSVMESLYPNVASYFHFIVAAFDPKWRPYSNIWNNQAFVWTIFHSGTHSFCIDATAKTRISFQYTCDKQNPQISGQTNLCWWPPRPPQKAIGPPQAAHHPPRTAAPRSGTSWTRNETTASWRGILQTDLQVKVLSSAGTVHQRTAGNKGASSTPPTYWPSHTQTHMHTKNMTRFGGLCDKRNVIVKSVSTHEFKHRYCSVGYFICTYLFIFILCISFLFYEFQLINEQRIKKFHFHSIPHQMLKRTYLVKLCTNCIITNIWNYTVALLKIKPVGKERERGVSLTWCVQVLCTFTVHTPVLWIPQGCQTYCSIMSQHLYQRILETH